jgi:hypothetical protein
MDMIVLRKSLGRGGRLLLMGKSASEGLGEAEPGRVRSRKGGSEMSEVPERLEPR